MIQSDRVPVSVSGVGKIATANNTHFRIARRTVYFCCFATFVGVILLLAFFRGYISVSLGPTNAPVAPNHMHMLESESALIDRAFREIDDHHHHHHQHHSRHNDHIDHHSLDAPHRDHRSRSSMQDDRYWAAELGHESTTVPTTSASSAPTTVPPKPRHQFETLQTPTGVLDHSKTARHNNDKPNKPKTWQVQEAQSSTPPPVTPRDTTYYGEGFNMKCNQDQVDLHYGVNPPHTVPKNKYEISLPRTVNPWHFWAANKGYCSETVLLQAGLAAGQFLSQYNIRKFCGSGYGQAGGHDFCAKKLNTSNYNAQMGLEVPNTGTSGPNKFANVGFCAAQQRIDLSVYDGAKSPSGWEGYRHYMSWIKGEFLKGRPVGLGMLISDHTDEQYDHVVNVQGIGTNHFPFTNEYYDDDTLMIDDNGALQAGKHGTDTDCHPYYYRYSFSDLATDRAVWFRKQVWGIVIPDHTGFCKTKAGGTGVHDFQIQGPNNFAWSSGGAMDENGDLVPVHLEVINSWTRGKPSMVTPLVGLNYEDNFPDASTEDCIEGPPPVWMDIEFQITVYKLEIGKTYHLYQYILDVSNMSGLEPLPLPTSQFNAKATIKPIVFTADAKEWKSKLKTTNDKVVAMRCVLATAP